jgi:hypothetical protein
MLFIFFCEDFKDLKVNKKSKASLLQMFTKITHLLVSK